MRGRLPDCGVIFGSQRTGTGRQHLQSRIIYLHQHLRRQHGNHPWNISVALIPPPPPIRQDYAHSAGKSVLGRLCLLLVKNACKCGFFADIPESPNFAVKHPVMYYTVSMSEENEDCRCHLDEAVGRCYVSSHRELNASCDVIDT